MPRRKVRSFDLSKAGIIRADDIPRSAICRPTHSSGRKRPRHASPAHTRLPSRSRLSRSGLETQSLAAPSTCRPFLTAARHDGHGHVQGRDGKMLPAEPKDGTQEEDKTTTERHHQSPTPSSPPNRGKSTPVLSTHSTKTLLIVIDLRFR